MTGRRAALVVVFLVLCGLVFVGGLVAIGNLMLGAGAGIALFAAGLWGWFCCCMSMAVWDARRPRPKAVEICEHWECALLGTACSWPSTNHPEGSRDAG